MSSQKKCYIKIISMVTCNYDLIKTLRVWYPWLCWTYIFCQHETSLARRVQNSRCSFITKPVCLRTDPFIVSACNITASSVYRSPMCNALIMWKSTNMSRVVCMFVNAFQKAMFTSQLGKTNSQCKSVCHNDFIHISIPVHAPIGHCGFFQVL